MVIMVVLLAAEVLVVAMDRVTLQEVVAVRSTSPTSVSFYTVPSLLRLVLTFDALASLQCWLAGPKGLVPPSR